MENKYIDYKIKYLEDVSYKDKLEHLINHIKETALVDTQCLYVPNSYYKVIDNKNKEILHISLI